MIKKIMIGTVLVCVLLLIIPNVISKTTNSISNIKLQQPQTENNNRVGEWDELRYDDFNTGWGSYSDGGIDCSLDSLHAHEGMYCVCIQDNTGVASSCYLTNVIDLDTPQYTVLKIDFWWMWNGAGWSDGEDWLVYLDDGGLFDWKILDMIYPGQYVQDVWYHQVIYIHEGVYPYPFDFPTNMRVYFKCDASDNSDKVYLDQISISASRETWSPGDIDLDNDIDNDDFIMFSSSFGRINGDLLFIPEVDYDNDGIISFLDYQIWLTYYYDYQTI